jgi:probable HAF family extracellular repeat protein
MLPLPRTGSLIPYLSPLVGERRLINDSGQIVGFYTDAQNNSHGFLLDQGSYTTLDAPGSTQTFAHGINASGQIVGAYDDAGGRHGFLATPVP